MSDVAEVKEAIDRYERWTEDAPELQALVDAARRWVRMVDGLDYEAAIEEYLKATARGRPMSLHPKTIVVATGRTESHAGGPVMCPVSDERKDEA